MKKYIDDLKNSRVLVTGGLGFVGSNLVIKLVNEYNCQVIVVDDASNGSVDSIESVADKVELHLISVLETEKIYSLIERVEYIFHLACKQISAAGLNPELDLDVNAKSTLFLLEYIRNNPLPEFKRFVYTSSCSVYGSSLRLPLQEESATLVKSHYAASKLLGENYASVYFANYQVPVSIVRYSNVYGYGQSPRNPYCGVLGKFVHNALHHIPLQIIGDGEQTRDYTFVTDAVNATLLSAVHPMALGEVLNIGTTVETSVNELTEIIKENIPDLKIEYIPERDIDNIRRRVVSIEKIHHRLGWIPSVNIKRGLKETIKWYANNLSKIDV